MRVKELKVRKIFDSRGNPTIEIELQGHNSKSFLASVPAGASCGSLEASIFDFSAAKKSVLKIEKYVLGKNFSSVQQFDSVLLSLDPTSRKEKLGGNVILGCSIAFVRALADEQKKAPWEVLRKEFFKGVQETRPLIFSNTINGGAHATNSLDIQEYMIIARVKSTYAELTQELSSVYRLLGDLTKKKYNISNLAIGDEGGYSYDFKDNLTPLTLLQRAVAKVRGGYTFRLGLDVAASEFYRSGAYHFGGKKLSTVELLAVYKDYFKRVPELVSIEDHFSEDDENGFRQSKEKFPNKLIVGDDLTVTNPKRIEKLAHSISGVIIKPNQVGSVSEACASVNIARKHGIKTIVSHRSGETNDAFIVHLAKAGGAYGLKIGVPIHERLDKFNELIRLYD
ncbi:MAG: hypothetical protein WC817_03625 [Patescibacteria group bacterium]|jgi:enolase